MPIELFISISALFGLAVGSFLNVVIHRLPKILEREWEFELASHFAEKSGQQPPSALPPYTLCVPRSSCPACGHQITARENVPLLSYLALGGKCKACKSPISPRYPLVEFLTSLSAALLAWKFGFGLTAFAAFFLVASLIALTFIDLDTMFLPDTITLPLLWAGLLFNTFGGFTDIRSAILGAAIGYLVLYISGLIVSKIVRRNSMGHGDFKLLAALGAWFGLQSLPPLIVISGITASIIGLSMLVRRKGGLFMQLPFGPYLALAGVITLLGGASVERFIAPLYLSF